MPQPAVDEFVSVLLKMDSPSRYVVIQQMRERIGEFSGPQLALLAFRLAEKEFYPLFFGIADKSPAFINAMRIPKVGLKDSKEKQRWLWERAMLTREQPDLAEFKSEWSKYPTCDLQNIEQIDALSESNHSAVDEKTLRTFIGCYKAPAARGIIVKRIKYLKRFNSVGSDKLIVSIRATKALPPSDREALVNIVENTPAGF